MVRPYNHLCIEERRNVYFWRQQNISVTEIAKRLGRHRSTIFREIQRNTYWDEDPFNTGYFHLNAQELYFRRRKKLRKVERLSGLKDHIIQGLKRHWSPEQIAGQLRASIGLPHCISHETIYRFIYSTEGKEHGLYKFLYRSRKFRSRRFKRKPRALRGLPDHVHIRYRPDYIDNRLEFGHWEADLMMFQRDKSTSNITTLIERKSRFTILLKNRSRHAQVVMSGIREALRVSVPYSGRKTITFDRGSEFMAHTMLVEYLNVKSYYCEPRSPWQKGTVENTNGRLRKFIPRSTNVNLLTDQDLSKICNIINNTPRKCLNYRTPQEIFLLERVAC